MAAARSAFVCPGPIFWIAGRLPTTREMAAIDLLDPPNGVGPRQHGCRRVPESTRGECRRGQTCLSPPTLAPPVSTTTDLLPLTATLSPDSPAAVAEIVRSANIEQTPLYPLGGGTSLHFGLPAKQPGWGVSLLGLNRVIDYPARDLTITVEAGITLSELRATLAQERQWLPIDAPQAESATLGGLIATGFSGPRRFSHGTLRDYVIGISAVDGRGVPFKGGGRVVKNVAGYDFCKLLIGSLGTLGIVTGVTLKVKPMPQAMAFVGCDVANLPAAEHLLAALIHSRATPTAVELLAGPAWAKDPALGPLQGAARLVIGLEGTQVEVDFMTAQLLREWQAAGAKGATVHSDETAGLWSRLTEFPADSDSLTIKASVLPSAVTSVAAELLAIDPQASLAAHAGNGVIVARFPTLEPQEVAKQLIRVIQPAAGQTNGSVVVLSAPSGAELTRQTVWGGATAAHRLMRSIKAQFDPQGLLNPGRFLY